MAGFAFDFSGSRGQRLSGRVERPETTPRGWAILAHCFTCGKDGLAASRLARALALTGIGVLRFDFAGIGKSEGEFADSTFAADVEDLIAAQRAMAEAGMPPSLLVGHSLGGAAVLVASANLPGISAVATIGAPSSVDHVLHQFAPEAIEAIERDGEAEVLLGGRPFVVRRTLLNDLGRHDLPATVATLCRPLLVMHAPLDQTVGIRNASDIFLAAKHPKSFVSLDGSDHLLTRRADADYAAGMIAAWAARYLPPLVEDLPQEDVAKGVTAEETKKGAFQLAIRCGKHRLIADEPVDVGGLDSGLSPYEFVAAGLAACTTMTMRLYADRKGFKLARARTRVEHSKRSDLTPADLFTRYVTLEGELGAEERAKILAIAERCPVDLTLVRGSEVETFFDEPDPSSGSAAALVPIP